MTDIEKVLARSAADPGFVADLARDPRAALAGYDLSAADLRRLVDAVAAPDGEDAAGGLPSLRSLLAGGERDPSGT